MLKLTRPSFKDLFMFALKFPEFNWHILYKKFTDFWALNIIIAASLISLTFNSNAQDYLTFGQRIEELIKSKDPSVKLVSKNDDGTIVITFPCNGKVCEQGFYKIPLARPNVFMNVVVLTEHEAKNKKVILVVKGGDANVDIKGLFTANRGGMVYLYKNEDLFLNSNISLVDTGCPTDKLLSYNNCADHYRKSAQYTNDFKSIIDFLKDKYQFQKFFIFGHSSGGISSKWLSVHLEDELSGAINSSAMTSSRGSDNLAHSVVGFDMDKIKIPVLNISHKDDKCLTTPYHTVKSYSKNNLVTVLGGGSSGPLCEDTNHHSFEGRQRGVARAIAKWVSTGEVQSIVDSDE